MMERAGSGVTTVSSGGGGSSISQPSSKFSRRRVSNRPSGLETAPRPLLGIWDDTDMGLLYTLTVLQATAPDLKGPHLGERGLRGKVAPPVFSEICSRFAGQETMSKAWVCLLGALAVAGCATPAPPKPATSPPASLPSPVLIGTPTSEP